MVIFSDLDNCLLERDSYDFSEASGALDEIRRRNIPLVLVSSKTRAEIELHRSSLAITAPFVVESGGALYLQKGLCPGPFDDLAHLPLERRKEGQCKGLGLYLEMISGLRHTFFLCQQS